ncbi:protein of unknown function [Rhodovastum atsumiense]|nr:protein of unknown function [Rhodovastum atsumiense]
MEYFQMCILYCNFTGNRLGIYCGEIMVPLLPSSVSGQGLPQGKTAFAFASLLDLLPGFLRPIRDADARSGLRPVPGDGRIRRGAGRRGHFPVAAAPGKCPGSSPAQLVLSDADPRATRGGASSPG